MFDLPDAKRIRREDLSTRSSSRSPSPDPVLAAEYHARLSSIYGPPTSGAAPAPDPTPRGETPEEEFAFRMFGGGGAQQVVIREEDEGDGGFLGGRDPRVFIVGRAEGERRAGFASAAVTGEDVLEWRRRRAWGLEVPWRVMVVRTWGRVVGGGRQGGEVVGAEGRRKRPGKKRRIELRGRRKKGAEAAERRRREGEEREAAEREKRTRRNREKKVKRKIKEKAKKAGVVDDAAELGEEGGDTMAGQSG